MKFPLMTQESPMPRPRPLFILTTLTLPCALAHASAPAGPSTLNEHFLDFSSRHSSTVVLPSSPLLSGLILSTTQSHKDTAGYEVSAANLLDEHQAPSGSLAVARRQDGSFVALVQSPSHQGMVMGGADGKQVFIESPPPPRIQEDTVILDEKASLPPPAGQNASAPLTVTLLAGFSHDAVSKVGDPVAYALPEVAVVNLGLSNAKVRTVRLSLAGIEITPANPLVSSQTLNSFSSFFANTIGADMATGFLSGYSGGTLGLAFQPGRYSLQMAGANYVFAHELGHNVGGGHCNTSGADDYRFGFVRTFQCSDSIPYYSSPAAVDSSGQPLGNAKTADMARLWREQAARMASYSSAPLFFRPYLLRNGSGNRCAAVSGNPTAGAAVIMAYCNDRSAGQRWSDWTIGTAHLLRLEANPALCLAKAANTSGVVLKSCSTDDPTTLWTQGDDRLIQGEREDGTPGEPNVLLRGPTDELMVGKAPGSGNMAHWSKWPATVQLKHPASGLCATLTRPEIASAVVFTACSSSSDQQRWAFEDSGRIRAKSGNSLCIGVGADVGAGPGLALRNCEEGTEQNAWGGMQGLIRNVGQGLCMGAAGQPQSGSPILLRSCLNNEAGNTWLAGTPP